MEESKIKEFEKKLRAMLMSEDKAQQHKNEQIKNGLCGARVIRRRNGSPDVAIT